MNEKVKTARLMLDVMSKKMYNVEKDALETIKEILRPCKGQPCLLGTEDYCEDIYYVYGEPNPNEHRRALAIRLNQITRISGTHTSEMCSFSLKRCSATLSFPMGTKTMTSN